MKPSEQKMIDISRDIGRINSLATAASLIMCGNSLASEAERDQVVTGLVETIECLSLQANHVLSEFID